MEIQTDNEQTHGYMDRVINRAIAVLTERRTGTWKYYGQMDRHTDFQTDTYMEMDGRDLNTD